MLVRHRCWWFWEFGVNCSSTDRGSPLKDHLGHSDILKKKLPCFCRILLYTDWSPHINVEGLDA
jgi:hypothetical protein